MNQFKKQTNPIKLWFAVVFKRLQYDKVYINEIPFPLWSFVSLIIVVSTLYLFSLWFNQDKYQTLVHDQYGFSIDYPANWRYTLFGKSGNHNLQDEKAQIWTNPILGFIGPANRVVYVYWTEMEQPTLDKAVEWNGQVNTRRQITYSDLQQTSVGTENHPALTRSIEYSGKNSIVIQYFVIREDGAFLLEFYISHKNDLDETLPIVEQMVSSFQMTKSPESNGVNN